MKRILIASGLLLALTACGTSVETGNVGVRTSWGGSVNLQEENPGWTSAFFDDVQEAAVKESTVVLEGLRPKAKDNLSLDALDVSVSYVPAAGQVAEFLTTKGGQSGVSPEGVIIPGYHMVSSIASSVVLTEASKLDSLTMHTKREALEDAVRVSTQKELDTQVPGFFRITRVVVTKLDTDNSIEEAIRNVVKNQKQLEAMAVQEDIAQKQADIAVIRAQGIADANGKINATLTPEYLQYQQNEAMKAFAVNPGTRTVVVPVGKGITPFVNAN